MNFLNLCFQTPNIDGHTLNVLVDENSRPGSALDSLTLAKLHDLMTFVLEVMDANKPKVIGPTADSLKSTKCEPKQGQTSSARKDMSPKKESESICYPKATLPHPSNPDDCLTTVTTSTYA